MVWDDSGTSRTLTLHVCVYTTEIGSPQWRVFPVLRARSQEPSSVTAWRHRCVLSMRLHTANSRLLLMVHFFPLGCRIFTAPERRSSSPPYYKNIQNLSYARIVLAFPGTQQ